MKKFQNLLWWWLYNSVFVPETIELYSLKGKFFVFGLYLNKKYLKTHLRILDMCLCNVSVIASNPEINYQSFFDKSVKFIDLVSELDC